MTNAPGKALAACARSLAQREHVRYLWSGAICALVNNVVLIGGDHLGIAYPVLVLLTWAIGGTAGFVLHCHITFRVAPSRATYARFMGGVAVGIPLSMLLLMLCVSWLKLPMWITAPLITIMMFLYNYLNTRVAILWRWWRPGHVIKDLGPSRKERNA